MRGLFASALAALLLLTAVPGRAQTSPAAPATDAGASRIEDFIRVAADGRDAADIRDLIASNEVLAQAGDVGQLPYPSQIFAFGPIDIAPGRFAVLHDPHGAMFAVIKLNEEALQSA